MSARHVLTPLALIAMVGLVVPPALADDQRPGSGERRGGAAVQRSAPRDSGRNAPQARGSGRDNGPRGGSAYAAPRERSGGAWGGNASRGGSGYVAPRDRSSGAWGGNAPRDNGPRGGSGYVAPRDRSGGAWGGYAPRGGSGYVAPRNRPGSSAWGGGYNYDYNYRRNDRRTVVVVPRSYGRGYAVPRGYGYYPPTFRSWIRSDYYYSRPYYAFRPRASIGFGVWLGYPVTLPSWGYAPFPLYGYPSGGYVNVMPSTASYGGVSFEITPYQADLYVDGQLIGQVGDFTPNHPPLTLAPGVHQVEVVAEGYVPLVFDVTVVPGQVLPYRGDLQPY